MKSHQDPVSYPTNDSSSPANGEVSGAFLLGLIESFCHLKILPGEGPEQMGPMVEAKAWYPYSMIVETLRHIETCIPKTESIFFEAGVRFLKIWYEKGPGRTMVYSGLDWLHANTESGGYNSVVRGGTPDEIGWCRLQALDVEAGIAVFEDVTPQNVDYVRGLFYAGCHLFNDMEFVEVTADCVPYAPNPAFTRKLVTVRFRLKLERLAPDIEPRLDSLALGERLPLTADEIESLIWRYKSLKIKSHHQSTYHRDISTHLANTVKRLEAAEEQIRSLAYFDPLTSLPNRRLLCNRLDQALAHAKRFNRSLAVIFLDLDHFKNINDTLGHETGDQLLIAVASRLSGCVRSCDTVSRQGGDEFVIVLTEIGHSGDAVLVAEKIIREFQAPFSLPGGELLISTSVGVCVFLAGSDDDAHELMKKADIAMYFAKHGGRNRFEIYSAPS